MERTSGKLADCLQHEPAFCSAVCPFHLDVRDFIAKLQRGAFNAAYRTYVNAVAFPGIVSALCEQPCKDACPRRLVDGAISLRLLEKAALEQTTRSEPNNYNLAPKNKKIAIIGAGGSGLACALRLAAKNYTVSVYERTDRIGGQFWDLLPPEVFLKDIQQQFMYAAYNLSMNREITRLDDLDCDAVYLASGTGGADFGVGRDPAGAFAGTKPGVFLGGTLTGANAIQALADGLQAGAAIERYLKTGAMNQPFETTTTRLELNPAAITRSEPRLPKNGSAYNTDEAILEAKRCLKCACDACVRYCDLMNFFKKYPKRIAEEVEITIHPGTLDGNGTVATRFISTCHQCGLCKEVCPQDIDTGEFLLQSHRAMRAKGAMPWAFHEFFLNDMAFSNSEETSLARPPLGAAPSRYVFFPGCQLGASDPQYVSRSYAWLLEHLPDTALMLACCGAPAEWAGDEGLHAGVISKLRTDWQALGQPRAIFACPTCKHMFKRHLPEIEGEFLYDLFAKWGAPTLQTAGGQTVSVFDPCSSREEPGLQASIRGLTGQAGFKLRALALEGQLAQCCSWGGQVSVTNPRYTREVVKNRVAQNELAYVTYCSNCRDIFAAAQKPAYHILDIFFGLHDSGRLPPTLSERRSNRVFLKRQVLQTFWKEEVVLEPPQNTLHLYIPAPLRQKLSAEMILETDIQTTIQYCESSANKLVDPESDHFLGHLQIGKITYWVEYFPSGAGFELVNAYSHRMSIEKG